MVLAAELVANLGQGEVGQLAAEVHRDLAGVGNLARFPGAGQLLQRHLEVLRRGVFDGGGCDVDVPFIGEDVAQRNLRDIHGDRFVDQRRVRRHTDERTLQFTDGGLELRGNEFQHLVIDLCAVGGRLLHQDGDAGFQVRRLHVGDQAAFEAGAQTVFQRVQLLRRAVGGQDDLFVGLVQRVEGVEELFLGSLFALEELDVVDHQNVQVAVAPLEGLLPVVAHGIDVVVGEFLGGDVFDAQPRLQHTGVVPGGVQEVRFAQARSAPDEQRVVGLGRVFGDGDCGAVGEAVGGADDEVFEGVLRVQARLAVRVVRGLFARDAAVHSRVRICFSTASRHLRRVHLRELVQPHRDLLPYAGCFDVGLGGLPARLRRGGRLRLGRGDGNGQVVRLPGVGGQQRGDVGSQGLLNDIFGRLVGCGE